MIFGGAGRATQAILEEQAPDHPEGFADDVPGHFGGALKSVGKDDRNFRDRMPCRQILWVISIWKL